MPEQLEESNNETPKGKDLQQTLFEHCLAKPSHKAQLKCKTDNGKQNAGEEKKCKAATRRNSSHENNLTRDVP